MWSSCRRYSETSTPSQTTLTMQLSSLAYLYSLTSRCRTHTYTQYPILYCYITFKMQSTIKMSKYIHFFYLVSNIEFSFFFLLVCQSLLETHDSVASQVCESPPPSPCDFVDHELDDGPTHTLHPPPDAIRMVGIRKVEGEHLVGNIIA